MADVTAGTFADDLKEIGARIKDLENAFKKLKRDTVVAVVSDNPGPGIKDTPEVMYQCDTPLKKEKKPVTASDFCSGLRAIRTWLQSLEELICGGDPNKVMIEE